ncbi:MFS transporter [Streptacidiphilus jiangxiensis]|uniref:Drug resistance transporter, EmrB/QacA subfamily n=1 Tax=Streptacidiphilus jiangxiensis TaxID=235985 RepID=A0A1H7UUG1_STRJI|nr:MFS transporter [Streptacidiphilus jiangxiensis]SEM00325.1 drug resistance transporter, EmrB/QacA subfamily [Streptacidiphilus jiangxiensis]
MTATGFTSDAGSSTGGRKGLVLAAMICAVAMTFIDQTIVSIAAPTIQHELNLSGTGVQWAVNAYLLAMAAFFALGGRLSDTLGHTRMAVIGVIVFAGASALCGLTPTGSLAQAWIITFRAVQGLGGALMYPAALAIVVNTYDLRSRGRALALFFGIAGGLTAVGPVLGGYLTEWTWRGIFWVNIPVALVALLLIAISKPTTRYRPAPIDWTGLLLIAFGVALSVFGFQQSKVWGWHNPLIGLSIAAGAVLLVIFYRYERGRQAPLIDVAIFSNRAFTVQCVILAISMAVFLPMFFFASEYAAVSLGQNTQKSGVTLLYFFVGFMVTSQIGGRLLDKVGAKRPVFMGSVIAAVGFYLWASKVTSLDMSQLTWPIIISGAGMGMMVGPSNTDAINRASSVSYGEATGITQTVRNYASSLSFAVLGTVMISVFQNRVAADPQAHAAAASAGAKAGGGSSSSFGSGSGSLADIPTFIRQDFAHGVQYVFYIMSGLMALAAVVALLGLKGGVQPASETDAAAEPESVGDAAA